MQTPRLKPAHGRKKKQNYGLALCLNQVYIQVCRCTYIQNQYSSTVVQKLQLGIPAN